jgi:hypothetical protein
MDLITDSTLRQLQQDIEQWHSNLPTTLRLRTERNSDPKAGLLCLFSVCVDFVFVTHPTIDASLSATKEAYPAAYHIPPQAGLLG